MNRVFVDFWQKRVGFVQTRGTPQRAAAVIWLVFVSILGKLNCIHANYSHLCKSFFSAKNYKI